MINITNENNSVIFYIDDEQVLAFPLNELSVLTEEVSDIVMFKTAKNFKTVVQERWEEITINGEPITKENIVDKFNEIANTNEGGAKINAGTNITLQEEADGSITISATGELGGTVAWGDVTDKPSTFTPSAHNHVVADITDLQGKLDEKANVSDIPNLDGYATEEWVNSQGYLTEHQDISQLATKSELATKQDTLVSGTNIKTINGESILGNGDIVIEGGTGDVTKQYVDEQLALKVDKTAYEADKATFALKTEIPSIEGLATSEELKNGLDGKQDKGDYALKSELPDISGLATKAEVDETYAKKTDIPDISNLATKEELASKADASALSTKQDTLVSGTNIKTINGQTVLGEGNIEIQGGGGGIADAPSDGKKYVRQNANWVEETTVDTSNFATKAELEGKVDDAEIADMLTKTEAASTYQPKGEYLTAIPDEYVTETELSGKGYLTEIPSEYVTETELSTKSYATTTQLDAKLDTETYNSDKATFATKEELTRKANTSDLSNYLQTSVAESTYAKESSLEELKTSKLDVSTYNQDKETFALKTEIPNDYLTDADLTDYLTKDEASETYRQKKIINFNRTNRSTEITNAWANSLNNIGATFQYVSFDEGATYNNVLYCGYRSYDGAGNRKGVGVTEIDGKMRSVIFEFSGIDCVATLEDEIDLSDYATKAELANKVDVSAYTEDKATFALKSELTNLATKEELNLKANTSDLSNYLQTSVAESTYAKKSEIPEEYTLPIATADVLGGIKVGAGLSINPQSGVLSATGGGTADSVDWANITSKPETFKPEAHQHVTADVTDLQDKLDAKADTTAIADMATKTWVGEQGYLTEHQDISTLATKQEVTEGLANKQDKGNYITVETADGKYQVKGDYLTSVPEEYVTETELNGKGYATTTQLEGKLDTSTYTEDKATFALKSEITDMATQTWVTSQGYLTEHQDISTLATKSEVTSGLATKLDTSTYTSEKETFALKSELTDFITASVDNLVNYYKKSETYTQSEIDGKISAITTINFEVVAELPVSGEANKIYLVPNAEQGEQNVKDEYIWVDEKWEIIGSTKVDLSNYYNKGDVDSKLSAKVDLSTYTSDKETFALKSEISDMATQTWVTSQGYLTSHQDISQLATKQEVTEGLSAKQDKGDYALKSELPDISNLATKDELNLKANSSDLSKYLTTTDAESNYAKKSEIPSLEDYLQTSVADEKYATKTELEGKVDDADIADMATQTWVTSQGYLTEHQDISQLATKQELTEGLAGKQAVGNYVTVESADAKYQVKGDYLTEIPAEYVTETELSEKGYLTAVPEEYVTDTELEAKGYKKIEYLTQTQYDELPNKEEGVLYVITDAPEVVIPDTSTFATKNELQAALDRISALESQIGILSAQLDSINGEIIN